MGTTFSTTDLTYLVGIYYRKKGLERLVPNLKLYQYAEKEPLPQGISNVITFHKFTELSAMGELLTEGVFPTVKQLSTTTRTATIQQRGNWTQISDVLSLVSVEPAVEAAAAVFGEQAAFTVDKMIVGAFCGNEANLNFNLDQSGHLSQYVGGRSYGLCAIFVSGVTGTILPFSAANAVPTGFPGGSSSNNPANLFSITSAAITAAIIGSDYMLDYGKVLGAVKVLESLNVPRYDDGLYLAVANPKVVDQLRRDNRFMEWSTYSRAEKGEQAVVGTWAGCKWIPSTVMPVLNSCVSAAVANLSVAFTYIGGTQCYVATEIDGGYKMYIKTPNDQDTSNPLNQWSTIGYKISMAASVLDSRRGILLMSLMA